MHSTRSAVASTLLAVMLASCSGGGGTHAAIPVPASGSGASQGGGANTASIAFRIALPATVSRSAKRAIRSAKPAYVAVSTQGVTIAIAYPGTTFATLNATEQCDSNGQNCAFTASTSLPVAPNPYTFTISAYGTGGASDVLSYAKVQQTLAAGANVVDVTLAPVVASVALVISGSAPVPGGANQTFPVTFTAFDGDGNEVSGTTPYATPFAIAYQEIDPLGAFALQPGSSGAATCSAQNQQCTISSNADSLEITYNAAANGLPNDPAYYPSEFVVYDANASVLSAGNSAAVATAGCATAQPLCVLAAPYYSALLASGGDFNAFGIGFSPTLVAVNQSTVWTDVGVVATGGSAPTFTAYSPTGPLATQAIGGIAYAPATGTAFTPDYTGDPSQPTQAIDSITAGGTIATSQYPDDTNTLEGQPSGAGIIVGPDGNLWWIDPITGVLRYANPSSPGSASSCVLQSNGATFLTAAQIVATPAGVTPARIWFSAVDSINTKTYLGYVDVSAGSNSCGSGQAGHYTAFDLADAGTATPPNGLAVDGAGNAWYNEGDNITFNNTNIGEATVNPSTGAVTVNKSQPLGGALGNANQAWGLVYDRADGNMYFADDAGLIGRFNPNAGISSATAYALPASLANLYDVTSAPTDNDAECFVVPGPCVPQFLWDPGTSANGRLTFVIPSSNSAIGAPLVTNVAVQLDLSGSGVTFSATARSKRTARSPFGLSPAARRHRRLHVRRGYRFSVF